MYNFETAILRYMLKGCKHTDAESRQYIMLSDSDEDRYFGV